MQEQGWHARLCHASRARALTKADSGMRTVGAAGAFRGTPPTGSSMNQLRSTGMLSSPGLAGGMGWSGIASSGARRCRLDAMAGGDGAGVGWVWRVMGGGAG